MSRKREKTTIIFVNKNQSSNRPIQVPSSFVQHWKKYLAGVLASFVFLLGTIFYLTYSRATIELSKVQLAQELQKSKKESASIDTSSLKKYYLSIDKKLLTINKYLKARGIRQIIPNVGGEQSSDILSTAETGEFYDTHLDKMIDYVAFTPMGYPHLGVITSGYGHRENPFTGESVERHKGLDIRGRYGEVVKSTASGRVVTAGRRGGYGNCVVISHGNGFETYYGHLSKILIKAGQQVKAGEKIGRIGSTGRSTGPHLHYEVHRYGKIINPRSFLTLE
ncbi:MAG TPA: M23 family metallopeptidase [Pedobacter sp.]|uniref:M23 family metallopeptidase n=1 Tax=Pedobacter sp. TaxID=1411316 RepID=UPI002B8FE444|nr:M23 family metallopeptidase [Pedobacter sp.]HMI04627.1 M23 family metallopeptidase [Pedobacter sp.]